MAPAEARRHALHRFGDVDRVRGECTDIRHHMETDMRRAEFFTELRQDARYAIRTLARSPLFTLVALLTMALGVGANTAVFSVVDAVLLRALPYRHADRTVVLWNSYAQVGLDHAAVSAPEYFDFKAQLRSLDAVAAIRPRSVPITGDGGDPEQLSAYLTTPGLFRLLGTAPFIGRDFDPADGVPGGPLVVILSHGLWTRRFGADRAIIGRAITIAGEQRTVIGVMPPEIRFPDDPVGYASASADVWLPTSLEQVRDPANRGNQNLVVLGRLRNGITAAQLDADIGAMQQQFKREYPDRYASPGAKNWHVVPVALRDQMVGAVRPTLLLITAAVALVLLIACVNVANLLLARGAVRRRELAVRLALGASRWRVCRQLLTESVVLVLGGGVLGAMLAWAGVRMLVAAAPANIPRLHDTRVDLLALAFTFGTALVTGVAVGIVPALQQSRADLRDAMNDGGRGGSDGRGRRRARTVLVIAEVAMALVILNSAGLLARSFAALQRVDPGFAPDHVMTMYLSLPRARYDSAAKVAAFYRRLQTDATSIPGVVASSGIQPLPMGGEGWSGSIDIEGYPVDAVEAPHAEFAVTMPDYFTVMRVPLVGGRDFSAHDDAGSPRVAIVDELLARQYWPNESALGKRINALERRGEWETVVGVARHVRSGGPQDSGAPQIYLPYLQHPQGMVSVVARTAVEPASIGAGLRAAVRAIDRDVPASQLRSMATVVADATSRQRFSLFVITAFAAGALGLASIGLYGVMSYLVAQRTREIGIRVALGGQPADVRRLILGECLIIAGAGVATGTMATLVASQALSRLLYSVSATDPATYTLIAALLLAVAGLAAFGPVRRATRVDPIVALRE